MISVGIDVAKDKHDYFIINPEGVVLADVFTIPNNVDARTIAAMLLSDVGLKPYTDTAYHNEELKSLTRYRFDKVKGASR